MAQLNPKEMQQALAKPFAPEDLEWRLQNTIEEQMRGLAVPYVTNRAIQNRLDEVCGPENWYNDFKPWHSNGKKVVAVLEDNVITGGLGEQIAALLGRRVLCFAYPDEPIVQGTVSQLKEKYGLTAGKIAEKLTAEMKRDQEN